MYAKECQECGNKNLPGTQSLTKCKGCHNVVLCEVCAPLCNDCLDRKFDRLLMCEN